ncbi:DUF1345 domain-containing protein [Phyllobacterium phragmitis]|uniref:DUF1345 domain-containing protein n=1 Tax=Phyllobacterium phragmitis TaxID=2670329 RepID=A0A2S9IK46_9HYPH|nr:DUF1345 domain-containing protein [Phyllobacterium phragmitis]PRD40897.1 DUF1345 domain-containing protein [Phyllobacterium phragmitis]
MRKRHNSFYIAATVGLATLLVSLIVAPRVAYVITVDAFFVVYLVLTGRKMLKLTPDLLRSNIARSDEPIWIIFAVTFGAVMVAVGSLFVLINSAQRFHPLDLSLTLAAVPLGWLAIHMMAAVHYAHLYWQSVDGQATDGMLREYAGGLAFQGDKEPGGIEFLYFSYVIGMAAETSDTAITNTDMRKINLLHGIVSFFFNTVLVAAAVNVAVSLGQ